SVSSGTVSSLPQQVSQWATCCSISADSSGPSWPRSKAASWSEVGCSAFGGFMASAFTQSAKHRFRAPPDVSCKAQSNAVLFDSYFDPLAGADSGAFDVGLGDDVVFVLLSRGESGQLANAAQHAAHVLERLFQRVVQRHVQSLGLASLELEGPRLNPLGDNVLLGLFVVAPAARPLEEELVEDLRDRLVTLGGE